MIIADDIEWLRSNVAPSDELIDRLPDVIRPHERGAAIRLAAEYGHERALSRMLQAQWAVSLDGAYALAAANGNDGCLKALYSHGASLLDGGGEPLYAAASRGHVGCLCFLLEHATWAQAELREAFLSALANHHVDVRDVLLAHSERLSVDLIAGFEADIVGACFNNPGQAALDTLAPFIQNPYFLPALESIALPKAVAFFDREAVLALLDVGCNPCANKMRSILVGLNVAAPDPIMQALQERAVSGRFVTDEGVSLIRDAGFEIEAQLLSVCIQ